jgi:chemotaxis protein CheC
MNTVVNLDAKEVKQLEYTFDQYIALKTCNALSTLFSEPISHKINVHKGISKFQNIELPPDEIKMCGVHLNGKGDIHIEICYTMKLKHAKKIAAKLLCQDTVLEIDEMESSAIQEVANILTGSFFNAMAGSTGFRVDLSTPDFAQGEMAPIISAVAKDVSKYVDTIVVADAELFAEKSGIKIHMMMMQDTENARKLINKNSSDNAKKLVDNFADSTSFGGLNPELDTLLEETNSSVNYGTGSDNSELDAIVNDALQEKTQ